MSGAQGVPEAPNGRRRLDGEPGQGDGLSAIAVLPLSGSGQAPGQIVQCLGIFRLEAEQLLEFGNSLVQLSLIAQRAAKVVVGGSVVGVQFDGLAVLGDGLVQLLLAVQDYAEAVVGRSEMRIELDGLA
jgi:hypothetical protein